jgi:hypothetical protein
VHVFVGKRLYELAVRIRRISNLDFGLVAFSHERPTHPVIRHQYDDEIVHANQPAFYALAGDGCDRDGSRPLAATLPTATAAAADAAARHPEVLEFSRVRDSRDDSFQIAAR